MTETGTHTPLSSEPLKGEHAPVGAPNPNVTMLKADIDAGRTGDKEAVFDPGLSMLGTDDEAGGNPNTAEQVAMARKAETSQAPANAASYDNAAGRKQPTAAWIFLAVIAVIGLGFVAALAFGR